MADFACACGATATAAATRPAPGPGPGRHRDPEPPPGWCFVVPGWRWLCPDCEHLRRTVEADR